MSNFDGIPYLSFTVNTEQLYDDLREILAHVRPSWSKDEIKFKKSPNTISHGMMNIMVACYTTSLTNNAIMCRVHGNKFSEFVTRKVEKEYISLLRKQYDFAPNILLTFDNGFCYDYIIGEPLSPETVKIDQVWRIIAVQMAQMHSIDVPIELQVTSKFYDFTFKSVVNYPEKLTDEKLNIRFQKEFPTKDLLLQDQNNLIEEIQQLNIPSVFTHTDSRPENMVWDKNAGKVTFVDFECCGYHLQTFDIAYHFFRYAGMKDVDFRKFPNEDFQRQWIKVYLTEYFLQTGKHSSDITDIEVEKFRVEVMKTYLLILLTSCAGGPLIMEHSLKADFNFDFFNFSALCYKEYVRIKDDILALKIP